MLEWESMQDLTSVSIQLLFEHHTRHQWDGRTMQWIEWENLLVLCLKLFKKNPPH